MCKTTVVSFLVIISTALGCGYYPKPMNIDALGGPMRTDGADRRTGSDLGSELDAGESSFSDGSIDLRRDYFEFSGGPIVDGRFVGDTIDVNDIPAVIVDSSDGSFGNINTKGDGGMNWESGNGNYSICTFGKSKFDNCILAP